MRNKWLGIAASAVALCIVGISATKADDAIATARSNSSTSTSRSTNGATRRLTHATRRLTPSIVAPAPDGSVTRAG